jgi:hypothetical protein
MVRQLVNAIVASVFVVGGGGQNRVYMCRRLLFSNAKDKTTSDVFIISSVDVVTAITSTTSIN